jgi:hypothetical protein
MALTALAAGALLLRPARQGVWRPVLPAGFTREFRRFYDRRRDPDGPSNPPDPAIARDLELMIARACRLMKDGAAPTYVENLTDTACVHAIDDSNFCRCFADAYSSLSLRANSSRDLRFIVAGMGAVSRTAVFDRIGAGSNFPPSSYGTVPGPPRRGAFPQDSSS